MKKNKLIIIIMIMSISLSFSMIQSFAEDDVSNNSVEESDISIDELINDEESDNDVSESDVSESDGLIEYNLVQLEEGTLPVLVDKDGNIFDEKLSNNDDVDGLGRYIPMVWISDFSLAADHHIGRVCESQAQTGTCWAFSSVGAAYSNLLMNNKVKDDADFSEEQIVWFGNCKPSLNTSDPLYGDAKYNGVAGFTSGGSVWLVSSILSRGTGLIRASNKLPDFSNWDSKDKFQDLSDWGIESLRYESEYMLTDSEVFDISPNYGYKQEIKSTLLHEGALAVSYYSDSKYYKTINGVTSYYDPTNENKTDHMVMIVGWDDFFSKDNFEIPPCEDGAWLCRNSWGSKFGDDGFFYISYFDPNLANATSFIMTERSNYGKRIYQYAGNFAGVRCYEGYGIAEANIFTATDNDVIDAVGVNARFDCATFDIEIYKNISNNNPTSGELVSKCESLRWNYLYPGFHIIHLTEDVSVKKGEKFSVVIIFKDPGARINVDSHKYSSTSSYVARYDTSTKKLGSWTATDGYDVDIKAYTKTKFDVTSNVSFSVPSGNYKDGQKLSLTSSTAGASIYYTLDGSTPSKANGILYTGPISLNSEIGKDKNYNIKAVAVKNGNLDSNISTYNYVIEGKPYVASSIEKLDPVYVFVDDNTKFEDIFNQIARYASIGSKDINMSFKVPINWNKEKPFEGNFDNKNTETENITVSGTLSVGSNNEKIDYSNTGNSIYQEVIINRIESLNLKNSDDELEDEIVINFSNGITDSMGFDYVDIYYTVDGTEPTRENGLRYDGQIVLLRQESDVNYTVRAKAYFKNSEVEAPLEFCETYYVEAYDQNDVELNTQNQVNIKFMSYCPFSESDYWDYPATSGTTFGESFLDFDNYTSGYEDSHIKFLGWYILLDDGSLGERIDSSSIVPSEDITIVGKWSFIYNITFNCDGGILDGESVISIEKGKKIEYLPVASKEGYVFAGWFYQDKEIKVGDISDIDFDIEVIAKWEVNGIQLYKGQKCDITDIVQNYISKNSYYGYKIKIKKSKNISIKKQKGRYILTATKAGEGFACVYAKKAVVDEIIIPVCVYTPSKNKYKLNVGTEISVYDLFNIPALDNNTIQVITSKSSVLSITDNREIKAVNRGKVTVTILVSNGYQYNKKYKIKVSVI